MDGVVLQRRRITEVRQLQPDTVLPGQIGRLWVNGREIQPVLQTHFSSFFPRGCGVTPHSGSGRRCIAPKTLFFRSG